MDCSSLSTDRGSNLIWPGKESQFHRDSSDARPEQREHTTLTPSSGMLRPGEVLPNPTEPPTEAFQTVSDLQRKVNELQGMVRSLTAGTEQDLTATGCEVEQQAVSSNPIPDVSALSKDGINAVSAAPRPEMMVRSGSEEELLKLYRERRTPLASESGCSREAAKSPRAGSHRAPVTPRVVPPQNRRASTGTLRASSPRFATPRHSSPEVLDAQPPTVGARMQNEQHRIFTSALRGGRAGVATQSRPSSRGGAGAAISCPDSVRTSACSTPVQASRRRNDPSPIGRLDSRVRAATPRSAPKTTPKTTPRRTSAAGSPPPATMHPLLAFAAEVQGLKANTSSGELSIAEPQSEPPTTPPLSARVASSRLGTPPVSSEQPTSPDEVHKTVVVPPCADHVAKTDCQSTPQPCASASGASTRASTPRVSGSTPGNDSAWDSRVDDFSAGPSAAPTPTVPSDTMQPSSDLDNARYRGQTPVPLRHSRTAYRATSSGAICSSDAGASERSVQAPSSGPLKCFIDESPIGQGVAVPRPVFGPPAFVIAHGSRASFPTTLVAGGRAFRSGSASAVRQHPVGLCQPHIAMASRTLSPARIQQFHPQVRCQMNF